MIRNFLLVGLGGGIGSVTRYVCQKWFSENYPHPFPWGTFVVNLIGCFLIGIIYAATEKSALTPQTRLLLNTGFCGGFTTFSAFSNETMNLWRNGENVLAIANVAAHLVLCLGAVWISRAIAYQIWG